MDAYLVSLARLFEGRVVTFDARLRAPAVAVADVSLLKG
jgi:hypothetical protein